jgi:ketosteroid isomerase-like protein
MLNVVRGSVLAMLVALMLGAIVAYLTPAGSATTGTEPADLQVEIGQAIDKFFAAVMSGDPGKVRAVLAPEFQIMRADGSTYDAAGYANRGLPVIAALPEIDQLVVTAHGDLAVAAYYVDIDQTRDGVQVEAHAPRLTVFRKEAGTWLMVAHGNFAALEQ